MIHLHKKGFVIPYIALAIVILAIFAGFYFLASHAQACDAKICFEEMPVHLDHTAQTSFFLKNVAGENKTFTIDYGMLYSDDGSSYRIKAISARKLLLIPEEIRRIDLSIIEETPVPDGSYWLEIKIYSEEGLLYAQKDLPVSI